MIHTFVIPGKPVAWRTSTVFKTGKAFDPKGKEKQSITIFLKHCMHRNFSYPIDKPLKVDFYFAMPIPKTWPKKKLKQFQSDWIKGIHWWHIAKPDATNMRKLVEDCLQSAGIVSNDSIVVCGETRKYYSEQPQTIIHIKEME